MMVSKYDIFYLIAKKGEASISEILSSLKKSKEEYQLIFNHVLDLEKDKYVKRDKKIKIVHSEKTKKLFQVINFCVANKINYNIFLKQDMINFLNKASQKEFFTIQDIKINPRTFKSYTSDLEKYGFLLIISKKPLECKLLRHHFIGNVLELFDKKVKFYNPQKKDYVEVIKEEYAKYKRNLERQYASEDEEETHFIYISLNLEGNPITLPDTQKILSKEIIPAKYNLIHINEIQNYQKAIEYMIQNAKNKISLTLQLIQEYHKLAMGHMKDAGELRKQNVVIKGNPHFKTTDWQLLSQKLNELIHEYEIFQIKKKNIGDIIHFAAFFHNEFQRIHPFIDGNSRTSRLLLLHILRQYDLPVLDLPLGYFDEYLDLTKRSKKRDDETFKCLVEEILLFNLKKINRHA